MHKKTEAAPKKTPKKNWLERGKDAIRHNKMASIVAGVSLAVASCKAPEIEKEEEPKTQEITNRIQLSEIPTQISLKVGDTLNIARPAATSLYGEAKTEAFLSDKTVADIQAYQNGGKDSLRLIGKKEGTTNFNFEATAPKGDFTRNDTLFTFEEAKEIAQASLNVEAKDTTSEETKEREVENKITLSETIPSSISLEAGQRLTFPYPTASATYGVPQIRVTSTNQNVATVTKVGANLSVEGKTPGEITLKIEVSTPAGETPKGDSTLTYKVQTKTSEKSVEVKQAEKTEEQKMTDYLKNEIDRLREIDIRQGSGLYIDGIVENIANFDSSDAVIQFEDPNIPGHYVLKSNGNIVMTDPFGTIAAGFIKAAQKYDTEGMIESATGTKGPKNANTWQEYFDVTRGTFDDNGKFIPDPSKPFHFTASWHEAMTSILSGNYSDHQFIAEKIAEWVRKNGWKSQP